MSHPTYRLETADAILRRVEQGESVSGACEAEGVQWGVWCGWVNQGHPVPEGHSDYSADAPATLSARCARARIAQAQVMESDIARVTEEVWHGALDPQRAKVVLSGLQWRASKLDPARYGDRIAQEVSGPGGGPITLAAQVPRVPDERAILIAAEEIQRKRASSLGAPKDGQVIDVMEVGQDACATRTEAIILEHGGD